jgi:K+-sensing histidine kinase KdpD
MVAEKNVMVCVTQQKTCERLIRSGAEIRDIQGGRLLVVHVTPTPLTILGNYSQPEALDYLYEISKSMNAEMTVMLSAETVKTLVEFCRKNHVATVVMGESLSTVSENTIIDELKRMIGKHTDIKVIPV